MVTRMSLIATRSGVWVVAAAFLQHGEMRSEGRGDQAGERCTKRVLKFRPRLVRRALGPRAVVLVEDHGGGITQEICALSTSLCVLVCHFVHIAQHYLNGQNQANADPLRPHYSSTGIGS